MYLTIKYLTSKTIAMKHVVFLFICVLFSLFTFNSSAQENDRYFPGGIISLNNDTIKANILLEHITKMQKKVRFIDAGGKKKSFKPTMINGYFLQTEGGKMVFESRSDITLSAFPSKKGNFYYRVSNDIYPLYYFVGTKMVNTGIESEMEEVKSYLIKMNMRWYEFTEESYKDCVKLFSMNRSLVNDIENDVYQFEDFPEIVHRYCVSLSTEQ